MGIINWASFFLESKVKLKKEELEKLLFKPAVRDLTLKEVRRVAELGNKEKVTSILSVYASKIYNDEDVSCLLTDEEKSILMEVLFGAKGDEQFNYACGLVCNAREMNKDHLLKSTELVAGAEKDFQAKYSSFVAVDSHIKRNGNFIRIIKVLTLLDKDKVESFYDYIGRVEETAASEYAMSIQVNEQLTKYEGLIPVSPIEVVNSKGRKKKRKRKK